MEVILAKHYTIPSEPRRVLWVVLHTMEAPEKPDTARAVAEWFAGQRGPAPLASAHYCIDSEETIQCVLESSIAWHAPGANKAGIGVEHAGFANQTTEQWDDGYSALVLEQSAKLCADICRRWHIPVCCVEVDGLLAGLPGITTHAMVSRAWRRSTHTDPGPHFPMRAYLDRVQELMAP